MNDAATMESRAMTDMTNCNGSTSAPAAAERVRYFPRQLLTDGDMSTDQEYFRLKLRRHNRFMHGWGTVCGLLVTAAPSEKMLWRVQIGDGYALGPYGDEIFVAPDAQVFLDLETGGIASSDPCKPDSLLGPGGTPMAGSTVYVAIQYAECKTRPVHVTACGCGCETSACENSRIRDSFQVQCLTALPPSYKLPPPTITLCDYINNREVPACPPCPTDPWVVLAAITLPASSGKPVTSDHIDNFKWRRQIFSTAVLQQQIIKCCCGQPKTPAQVTNFSRDDSHVRVTFNKSLDPSTVNGNTFQVLVESAETKFPGSVTYDDPSKTATFTANNNFPSGDYKALLLGTGPSPILDVDGLALDGQGTGTPGSDYTKFF